MPALALIIAPLVSLYIKFRIVRIAIAIVIAGIYYYYFSQITDIAIKYLMDGLTGAENSLTGNVRWAVCRMGMTTSLNILLTALGYLYTYLGVKQALTYVSRAS